GRVSLEAFELQFPQGDVRGSASYRPWAQGVEFAIELEAEGFDYGFIARRKKKETEMRGRLDLDLQFESRAPSLERVMAHATGFMDFEICPEGQSADVFDLWATNVLLALLPRLDPERKSKMNCLVGELDFDDGLMTPERLILDTTRVRVEITGEADFKTEELLLRLKPEPKRPQLLSLETPVRIDGSFDDFRVRVTPVALGATGVRVASRVYFFPVYFALSYRLPEDGSDICGSCGGSENAEQVGRENPVRSAQKYARGVTRLGDRMERAVEEIPSQLKQGVRRSLSPAQTVPEIAGGAGDGVFRPSARRRFGPPHRR
ncbi:MAG: AsmA-like C-terminal region-containing protein, partial [Verrucomicrobiales bacterium]